MRSSIASPVSSATCTPGTGHDGSRSPAVAANRRPPQRATRASRSIPSITFAIQGGTGVAGMGLRPVGEPRHAADGDAGGDPVVERREPDGARAAEADAEDGDLVGIDESGELRRQDRRRNRRRRGGSAASDRDRSRGRTIGSTSIQRTAIPRAASAGPGEAVEDGAAGPRRRPGAGRRAAGPRRRPGPHEGSARGPSGRRSSVNEKRSETKSGPAGARCPGRTPPGGCAEGRLAPTRSPESKRTSFGLRAAHSSFVFGTTNRDGPAARAVPASERQSRQTTDPDDDRPTGMASLPAVRRAADIRPAPRRSP